tara:strand:+ start:7133 stop:9982 length:2850 start_codon:yes stop_codon:yes gene_type:complete
MSSPVRQPLKIETVDGATEGRPITTIKVSNGDLTVSGTTATIDTSGSGGSGTVTSITAGTGLDGGTITTSGTIDLANTAVTAASYTSADITINAQGQITAASSGGGGGTITGSITDTQVAFGDTTADSIQGSSNFTFDGSNLYVSGYIKVGGGAAGITTTGTTDLVLTTNTGSDSGAITITDGVDGGINVAPNGAGFVTLGNYKFDVDQAVGVGQDEYVLTYDHAAASISLAAGGGGGGTVTSVTGTLPISSSGGATPDLSITQSATAADGYLSSTDWNSFDGKQDSITLTTTGTSGAATLVGATLNVPQYTGGGTIGGSITDNQVGVGATTANSIEGSSSLTFDAATGRLVVAERISSSGTGALTLETNDGVASGKIEILNSGVLNHINIEPASGTLNLSANAIRIGDTSAKITTQGAYDLTLNTADGTNSGSIVITDGVNGQISITPNGTGAVEISGAYKLPTAVTGANDYILTAQTDGSTAWAAGGGGTFSGSLADTQVAFGNTTADSIQGSSSFTYDNTNKILAISAGTGTPTIQSGSADLILRNSNAAAHSKITLGHDAANSDILLETDGTGLVNIYHEGVKRYSLPNVTTTTNDYILTAQTDGSTAWAEAGGGGTFSGSLANTQLAFGNTTADSIQGSSQLTYNGTTLINTAGGIETSSLNIGKSLTASGVVIEGSTGFDGLLLRGNSSSGTITTGTGSSADLVLTPSASGKVKMSAVEFGGNWNMTDAVATVNDQVLTAQTDGSTAWAAAGGGGGGVSSVMSVLQTAAPTTTYDYYPLAINQTTELAIGDALGGDQPNFYPFTVGVADDLVDVNVYCSTASTSNTLIVGIYSDSGGFPNSQISNVTLDMSTTGTKTGILSATTTLALGVQYWVGVVRGSSGDGFQTYNGTSSGGFDVFPSSDPFSAASKYRLSSSNNVLPATITSSNLTTSDGNRMRIRGRF